MNEFQLCATKAARMIDDVDKDMTNMKKELTRHIPKEDIPDLHDLKEILVTSMQLYH